MRIPTTLTTAAAVALLVASAPANGAGAMAGESTAASESDGKQRADVAARPIQWFQNEATGACLDHSDRFGLRAIKCYYNSYQKWYVRVWPSDGTRELENTATNECLSAPWWNFGDPAMEPCDQSESQSWYVRHWEDGTIRFKNQRTGECLDHSGTYGLRTYPCNRGEWQSWK